MNWIAFGYALLGCALFAICYGGVATAIHGFTNKRLPMAITGLVAVALSFSAAIGLCF